MKTKWTDEAWTEASGIYAEIISHPFIQEIADGTLSADRFKRYIAQDELYLANYGRQMHEFAEMLEDPIHRQVFNDFAEAGLAGERAMHQLMIDRFGINTTAEPSAVTSSYNEHTEAAIRSGKKEIAFAALLPCIWIYNEVGKHLKTIAKEDGNPYSEWIDEYGDEELSAAVEEVLSMIDLYASRSDDATRKEMTRQFHDGTRFELAFWDSAYRD